MAGTRPYAQLALDHIRHLAETIGPRGSTTSGQREGAEPLTIARQVTQDRPELRAFERVGISYTDTAILLKNGFRAFTIDALPRDEAGAVHWHQMSDTVDKIEVDCLERVHEFVWEILQRLDAVGRS